MSLSPSASSPRVLVLQMGLNDQIGKYFAKLFTAFGIPDAEVVKVAQGGSSQLDWREYDGILLTGSSFMVTEEQEWSVATGRRIRPIVEEGIVPVFGVCYGHQLILHALGGSVGYASKRQIGTKECNININETKNCPIFSVFQDRSSIVVHVLHRQVVTSIPPGVSILAYNDIDQYHALKPGPRCWVVQFHPEMHTKNINFVVDMNKHVLPEDGLNYDEVRATVRETKDGEVLLERFARVCEDRFKERTGIARI